MRWTAFILAALAPYGAAACPSYDYAAIENYHIEGDWLAEPVGFYVIAGGRFDVAACGVPGMPVAARGFFEDAPDFAFQVSGIAGRRLTIRVASECDAALLVNSATGAWFYDDDDSPVGSKDPQIVLTRPVDGRIDVWVGQAIPAGCRARLTLQAG